MRENQRRCRLRTTQSVCLVIVFIAWCALLVQGDGSHRAPEEDLIVFYRTTGGPDWIHQDGWKEAADRIGEIPAAVDAASKAAMVTADTVPQWCSWYGLECEKRRVSDEDAGAAPSATYVLVGLALPNNNLRGAIPLSIFCRALPNAGVFSTLRIVNVSGNFLEGDGLVLHTRDEQCPRESAAILQNLVTVDVSHNHLSASMETLLLRSFPRLRFLSAGYNKFMGPIFDRSLSGMSAANAGDDGVAVTSPQQLLVFPLLEVLDLRFNRLLGQFPTQTFAMHSPHLRELYLDNNFLVDSTLSWLHVASAEGVGNGLGWHHTLAVLHLANNYIQASIPNTVGSYNNLRELVLDGNRVYGTLPRELRSLRLLNKFSVAHNFLRGTIPCAVDRWFTDHTPFLELRVLDLTDNEFEGAICEVDPQHTIEVLRLADNAFRGTLPPIRGRSLKEVTLGGENRWLCELPSASDIPGWIDPAPSTMCSVDVDALRNAHHDAALDVSGREWWSFRRHRPYNATLGHPLGSVGQHVFSMFLSLVLLVPISLAIVTAAGVELPAAPLFPRWLLDALGYEDDSDEA